MPRPSTWIVNASPFIGLAKTRLLGLRTGPGRTALLPETVAHEVGRGPADDAAVRALLPEALAASGFTLLPPLPPDPLLSAFKLDPGEAAVLTAVLARPGSVAVIDDGAGRAAARALGVTVTGSLSVLIAAKREGRLPALVPAIQALEAAGISVPHEAEMRRLLAGAGETWP